MGKNKQVKCRICNKTMRSNNFTRHIIQHEKKNDPNLSPVNKLENQVLKDGLEKYLLEKTEEFKELIEKGKEVYEILGKGEALEKALPKDIGLDVCICFQCILLNKFLKIDEST